MGRETKDIIYGTLVLCLCLLAPVATTQAMGTGDVPDAPAVEHHGPSPVEQEILPSVEQESLVLVRSSLPAKQVAVVAEGGVTESR